MKVTFPGISGEGNGNLILTNAKGGFLNLGIPNTKFQGFFMHDEGTYKIIEDIRTEGEVTELVNEIFQVKRLKKNLSETYFLPKNFNSLIYELSSEKEIELIFDIREIYDMSDENRKYKCYRQNNKIVVEFDKYAEKIFVVIGDVKKFAKTDKWVNYFYTADEKRNSPPFSRYVYSAFKTKAKRLAITACKSKRNALAENDVVLREINRMKLAEKHALKKVSDKKISIAANALNALVLNNSVTGIMGGIPWFFQVWTRDEMISLKALDITGEAQLAKKILVSRIAMINDKGQLPNRIPASELDSADSVGWMFFRLNEFLKLFSAKEKQLASLALKNSIELLIKNYHKDGFFFNNNLETWMDTNYGNDFRNGARIEIQALMIKMYELAYRLTKEEIYLRLNKSLLKNVRDKFFANNCLKDGLFDYTVRPNIFIAYYICPELLSKEEWELCFETALEKLWLPWGGISTIDKNSSLFTADYTGENNKSYHRGDSWYWLNNLAAICLLRVNKKKFSEYAEKIFSASLNDMLWNSGLGHCSEVSSASHQTHDGCSSQAWSSAMLIELWKELGHKIKAKKRIPKAQIKRKRGKTFRIISVRKR